MKYIVSCFCFSVIYQILQYITLHYITLRCITLHYTTPHCIMLHCITLHYICYTTLTGAMISHTLRSISWNSLLRQCMKESKKQQVLQLQRLPLLKAKTCKTISNPSQQLDRWVEHYLGLYATQNVVSRSVLDSIPDMPIMEELVVLPTIEELDKAINALANRKAPGVDGIPPEILKTGKPALMQHLYELLCLCLEKGYVPKDMRDAITVTLYKNKGDCSDCNNNRGISLLSIVGKAFAQVSLYRLQKLASCTYSESHDMIFSLR